MTTPAPREAIIEPDLPIIDPHHHLWDRRPLSQTPPVHGFDKVIAMSSRYMLDELMRDLNSGHNIRATVFVECRAMYRADGPEAEKPLGETEFVNGIAAMSASGLYGPTRVAAGIVGRVDLMAGDAAGAALEAHVTHAPDRFRGIRHAAPYDADPAVLGPLGGRATAGTLASDQFRAGFAHMGRLGLSFDAWMLEPQIPDVTDLARAFPDTSIILDHVGTPLNIGAYEGRLEERFPIWQAAIRDLAACENVTVKLGGLAMPFCNLPGFLSEPRLGSEALAAAWRPYVDTCIEAFGVDRCMFESNFPVDLGSCDYATLWNALKRIASGASADEKTALFSGTAGRVYKIAI
ncbi:MAG: putative TIM-barrel fold metal-dependent hydrolase [Paracoccaceae bacterium]|jgi:predicted TIM-barrel fold metal-dependent hydrolase